MRALMITLAIIVLFILTGVISACVIAGEEDERMNRFSRWDKSCNYRNCDGDCDNCDK